MVPTAAPKTAMCRTIQSRRPTAWTSRSTRRPTGPYIGHSHSPASREDEIRHLRSELDQARRDAQSMSNDIRELVAGIRDLSSTLIRNNNSSMNITHNSSNRRHQLSISVLNDIDTFDGKQGHKLDDWLADVENAAAIIE